MDDVLGMSDEQFMELSPSEFEQPTEEPTEQESVSDSGADDYAEEPAPEESETPEPEESDVDSDIGSPDFDDSEDAEEDFSDDSDDESPEQEEAPDVDYKAFYEQLTKPFKANGKEMRVESAEDVISLMQMGANYNKKMASLKPNLKLMKMLENNGVLNEDKLSFFIDLEQKNPEAIKKLVRDSGVDTYSLDDDQDSDYTPGSYTVGDKELELDSVLEEIEGTDTYNSMIDVVSNKWDKQSQIKILENPVILKRINEQMGNGLYAQITEEIERERTLGRLSGLSDLEAYRQVGDKLFNEGRFNQPQNQVKPSPDTKSSKATKTTSEKSKANAKRKKAAASPRSSKASNQPSSLSPLALSDEEFAKQFSEKFL